MEIAQFVSLHQTTYYFRFFLVVKKKSFTSSVLGHEALLLLTSIIWGLAFVAQRAGMESIGPFAFNGIRFILGSLSLLPLILFLKPKPKPNGQIRLNPLIAGLIAGIILFIAASLQQVGMVYTTASNGGFITSLYVIIVPLLGLLAGERLNTQTWIGAVLAVVGLYLLSVRSGFSINPGDLLVLASALFWAIHLIIIGYYSNKTDVLLLAAIQFAVTGVLSLAVSSISEQTQLSQVVEAGIPILYGGLMSVGVAYTLQIVGQRKALPAHAAIILSLEALFAAIGGWIILHEKLSLQQIAGGLLMLAGLIVAQLHFKSKTSRPNT